MDDLHIEDFYLDVANTFLHLYKAFPNKTTLYIEDLIGMQEADEFGLHNKRHMSCLSALVWLGDQGFIEYESLVRQEAVDQIVLAEKSFLLLSSQSPDIQQLIETLDIDPNQSPDLPLSVADEHATNIRVLSQCKRSSSSFTLKKTVLELLKQSQQFR